MNAASQKGHTEVVDLLVQAGADTHLATTLSPMHPEPGHSPDLTSTQDIHSDTAGKIVYYHGAFHTNICPCNHYTHLLLPLNIVILPSLFNRVS